MVEILQNNILCNFSSSYRESDYGDKLKEVHIITGYKVTSEEWAKHQYQVKKLTEQNDTKALEQLINNYTQSHPESTVKVELDQIYLHPNYGPLKGVGFTGIIHDLALIKLPPNIPLFEHSLCLPEEFDVEQQDEYAAIAGYGSHGNNGPPYGYMPLQIGYHTISGRVNNSMLILTSNSSNAITCQVIFTLLLKFLKINLLNRAIVVVLYGSTQMEGL